MASFSPKRNRRVASRVRRSVHPQLERLEDRLTPATINVTSTADTLDYDPTVTVAQLNPSVTPVTLRDAINAANNTGGSNTIVLQQGAVYDLTEVDNYWYGPDGLPAISSDITLVGNGATIQRDSDVETPAFRLFYVSGGMEGELSLGQLTLQDVTLQNGLAQGGSSIGGGGGMGAGGAIFNQGALTLVSVTLTNNEALGGSSNDESASGYGGGGMGGNAIDNNGGGFGGTLVGGPYGGQGASGSGSAGGGGGGFLSSGADGSGPAGGGLGGFGSGSGDGGDSGTYPGLSGDGGNFGSGGSTSGGVAGGGGVGGGGGNGAYGGGGGGFGGGGGTGTFQNGGNGGFGGGGGSSEDVGGNGGFGGGDGADTGTRGGGGGGGGFGGAIFNMGASLIVGSGSLTITNSTLTGNTAQGGDGFEGGDGLGGAVFNLDGNVTLNNDTLAANTIAGGTGNGGGDGVALGGAVYNLAYGNVIQTGDPTSANLTLNNSILSNSIGFTLPGGDVVNNGLPGGADLFATVEDGNNTNSGTIAGSTNLVQSSHFIDTPVADGVITSTTDPNLGLLQNNGGLTFTMADTPDSAAYGAGNINQPGLPATDQRGLSRLNTQGLDLGAFEFQTVTPFPPTPAPSPSPSPSPAPPSAPTANVAILLAEDQFALTVDTVMSHLSSDPALLHLGDTLMTMLNNLAGATNPALGTGLAGLQAAIYANPYFGTPLGNLAQATGLNAAAVFLANL